MQYELQTTLSVALEKGEHLESVRGRLEQAVRSAVSDPSFGQIEAFKVTIGDRENELVIGILFRIGVSAKYIDEIGEDLVNTATALYVTRSDSGMGEVSEESVRLQSVYA